VPVSDALRPENTLLWKRIAEIWHDSDPQRSLRLPSALFRNTTAQRAVVSVLIKSLL
jgi:hypothetical protein